MIQRVRISIASTSLLAVFGAQAAPGLSDCVAIEADSSRLSCYDRAAGRSVAEPAAAPMAIPAVVTPEPSLLTENWELEGNSKRFYLRRYKPVYLLPYFHASRTNPTPYSPTRGPTNASPEQVDSTEAKFQLSFKTKIFNDIFGRNGDVWGAYTQSSRWQLYNGNQSRPFRETNYEPEVMFVWRTNIDLLGAKGRYVALGINHQSNGQGGALSRSWNRITSAFALEQGRWTLTLRPWWRIPEHSNDDNPDIADYAGRGELIATGVFDAHVVSLEARHSLHGGDRNHGSIRLDWAFPINERLKGHLQWFNGYAENLIDYNHRATYLGVGFSLVEWH
jgi:phospholipase A1